uniref:KH domain-containing RNA-binding signal transduction-associated protein n=1 Tax=Cerebratulus lacteus TaxID=6221 RepID=A0A0G2YJM8_CERLA|nr:KH domain-containing RNA-binding signal transduction-associated protein [Cerebratulus lacteus]
MADNAEYQTELTNERNSLGPSFTHTTRLVDQEIQRIQNGGKTAPQEASKPLTDVTSDKYIKVSEKVLIPVKQFPKFNFVGKLLGPKGHTLKRLQDETKTKMAILGRGSMRDKQKEEECRKEGGKYAHLAEDLHVYVEASAVPCEAHSRIAHALSELKQYLIPDPANDEIRQQQMEEMAMLHNGEEVGHHGHHPQAPPPRGRGRGRPGPPPPPQGSAPPPSRVPRGGGLLATPPGRGALPIRGGAGGRGAPVGRGAPARPGSRPPPPYVNEEPYYEEYTEPAYEEYDQGYQQTGEQYYETGYGQAPARETYEDSYDYRSEPVTQQRRAAPAERGRHYEAPETHLPARNGDSWGAPPAGRNPMKMPPTRQPKPEYRPHPYGQRAGGY